ncbi:MarR family transcriptional regulator [Parasphingorhabdus sp.]|uniref:MarR family winged helix-turn-helix transcriptional regulator n=1 Tax=Parasphingorhabdus sp. TaxID=2709688 RepID=UPI0013733D15
MTAVGKEDMGAAAVQQAGQIEFSFLLGDVTRKLRRAYDKEMQQLGLTRAQWQVLVRVLIIGSPTQTELADSLDIGRASAGNLIRQLEEKGYIKRYDDEDDQRVRRVIASKRAIASSEKMTQIGSDVASRAFAGIAEDELAVAAQVLGSIRRNVANL